MGSSVFTGITVTKAVGIMVLADAPSHLFRLYYFRLFAFIILGGAFHGLVFLPVALSLVGWEANPDATPARKGPRASKTLERRSGGPVEEAEAVSAVAGGADTGGVSLN